MSDYSKNLWQQTKLGNFDALKNAIAKNNPELDVDFAFGPMHEALLHLVAAKGDAEVCQLLINKGCNLNAVNRQGVTALYVAAAVNSPSLVELLMKSGADPNTMVPTGLSTGTGNVSAEWLETCRAAPSPLLVAAHRGLADVVETMLGFSALDTAASNEDGNTALHLACAAGHLSVARLLAGRIDPSGVRNAAGKTALDLATGDELREALSNVRSAPAAASKSSEDPDTVLARCGSEVPETFGRDLALQLYSENWKHRAAGLDGLTAHIKESSGPFAGRVSDETFEATCAVLTDLIHDKHQKVFQACLVALQLFFATGPVANKLPITKDEMHPAVELIYAALLKKMESAQARQANDATKAILDLVMTSEHLAVSSLVELVYAYDPAPARGDDGNEPAATPTNRGGSNNWRPLHARLRILGELVKLLGDREGTGLEVDRTLDVALPCLENASVQVRKSALEITAGCLVQHAKAQAARGSGGGGSASLEEAVLEIKEDYLGPPLKSAVMKQVMSKLCKALKVKIHKSASSSKSKSKKGKHHHKSSGSRSKSKSSHADAMGDGADDDGDHEFDVQPLSKEDAVAFADVTSEFGETVAQYVASQNWQARKRGIKMIVDLLREASKAGFRDNPRRLKAAIDVLARALTDTVQHIYVSGLKLARFFGELAQKESRAEQSSSGPTTIERFFDALRTQGEQNLLPVIISKFSNTKERVRKQTGETLASLSRLGSNLPGPAGSPPRRLGVEAVISALVSEIENAKDKDSTYLVKSRLETLCALLSEHGVPVHHKDTPPAGFYMETKTLLDMASQALLARDAAARATADQLFEYLSRQVGRDVLEELPHLSENGRLRLKACLAKVETLQNFEAVSLRQPAAGGSGAPPRPGASSGRPGASSGRPGAPNGRPSGGGGNGRLSTPGSRGASPGGGRQNLSSRRARLQSAAGPRACDLITKLPQADPVPAKLSKVAAPMYAWFGEDLTRCLLASDWNLRHTGIVVLRTRMLQACNMVPQEQITEEGSIPSDSLDIVQFTIDVIARACDDRIAKVYESAMDLLHVLATNYVGQLVKNTKPSAEQTSQLVATFTPAVVGILPKLNHRNERLRFKSEQLLLHLCRIPFLGPRCISSLVASPEAFRSHNFSGPTLVGIFTFVRLVIEEFGIGSRSGFDPDSLMEVLVPALENKHLDVRKAATELYAVLYLAVGDNAHHLNELISGLKSQVKAKCTSAVNLLKTKNGGHSPASSPANADARARRHSGTFGSAESNEKQKHQGLMRQRMEDEQVKLAPIFGEEASKNLCNPDSWETRATALTDLSNALLDGEALAGDDDVDSEKSWAAVCNVMKQGLMSPWPLENLGALELIGTVVDAIPGMEIEIPWDSWEARLVLGSIVKSLVENSSSKHVRVREVSALTLSRVADAHSVGLSLAARYLLSEVKLPNINPDSADHAQRLNYARYGHGLLAKLKLVREIVRNDCFSAGCSNLTLEAVLTFGLKSWEHSSHLVQMWAKNVCAAALQAAGAEVAAEYVAGLPAQVQMKLRQLLPEMSASQLDEQRRAALAGNGSMADSDGAVASGAVRGPTFSPIDTEAGSKSRSRALAHHRGGGGRNLNVDPQADELAVNFGTVSSPSFSAGNLPPSGRIRPRRKSSFRSGNDDRSSLSSAPASDGYAPVDFSGVESPKKPGSAPWLGGNSGGGGGGGRAALQEEARKIARGRNRHEKVSMCFFFWLFCVGVWICTYTSAHTLM